MWGSRREGWPDGRPQPQTSFVSSTPGDVSVVTTVWNGATFIAEALESALAQTVRPAEIIVVDDGSTDQSRDIARSFSGVTVIEQAHQGSSAGRNLGLTTSRGRYVAFLDADDVWLPRKLELQRDYLEAHLEVDAAFCRLDEFYEGGAALDGLRPARLGSPAPLPSACLIRREACERIGSFTLGTGAMDWVEWWSRAASLGIVSADLDEVLLRRRLHGANASAVERRDGQEYLAIARSHLQMLRTRNTGLGT